MLLLSGGQANCYVYCRVAIFRFMGQSVRRDYHIKSNISYGIIAYERERQRGRYLSKARGDVKFMKAIREKELLKL